MKAKTSYTPKQKLIRAVAIGVLVISPLAICGSAPIARARDAAVAYSRISAAFNQAKAELKLTEQQQTQIHAILREAIPQGIAVHDNMKLSGEEKRTRLNELRATTRRRIEEVLTAEQRRKALNMLANARPRAQARLQQVAQELELTDAQKAEVRPILANAFKQGKAIKEDMNLTIAQKLTKGHQLKVETREQLSSILTAAQMKKLDSIIAAAQTDFKTFANKQLRHIG